MSHLLVNSPEDEIIERFKSYLRIKTISALGPLGSYNEAVEFLASLLKRVPLDDIHILREVPEFPILVASWKGENENLPSILLNSHFDVVPVYEDQWSVPPFEGFEDEKGDIYGRGTQDMKSVGLQYIEALSRLKASGKRFKRTIHLAFVPDEETGGFNGMGILIKSEIFKSFNVGVALDEGLANPTEKYTLFYGERRIRHIKIISEGPTGHASRFIENTATEKLIHSINKLLSYRTSQLELYQGCKHAAARKLGDVATLNLTALKAGVTFDGGETYMLNVIPNHAEAGFDIRLPVTTSLREFEEEILKPATAEQGLRYEYVLKTSDVPPTSLDPNLNPYWKSLSQVFKDNNIDIEEEIFPAATDSRFLRELNIPCFGFSPMNNSPILLHDHNEKLNRRIYLNGISIYEKIIAGLANTP